MAIPLLDAAPVKVGATGVEALGEDVVLCVYGVGVGLGAVYGIVELWQL